MPEAQSEQTSFGSGEITPSLKGRSESRQFRQGVETLENAVIGKFGSVKKRPGSEYVASTKDDNRARIIRFPISGVGNFIVEITASFARVYDASTRTVAQDSAASDVEFSGDTATPWDDTHLDAITWAHNKNQLFIFHREFAPRVLTRARLNTWTMEIFDRNNTGPWLEDAGALRPPHQMRLGRDAIGASNDEAQLFMSSPYFRAGDANDFYKFRGDWFFVREVFSSTEINARRILTIAETDGSGNVTNIGEDRDLSANDWSGPYERSSGPSILSHGSGSYGDVITIERGSGWSTEHIGLVLKTPQSGAVGSSAVIFVLIGNITGGSQQFIQGVLLTDSAPSFSGSQDSHFWTLTERWAPDRPTIDLSGSSPHELDVGDTVTLTASSALFSSDDTSSSKNPATQFNIHGGVIEITSHTSSTKLDGEVKVAPSAAQATKRWARTYGRFTGFPSCGVFHQNRFFMGGVPDFPDTIAGSRIGVYDDFSLGDNDDDAVTFEMAADNSAEGIQWMSSVGDLLVGTEEAEYLIEGSPISRSDVDVNFQSGNGGRNQVAVRGGTNRVFVGRSGKDIYASAFRFETDKYEAPSISDHAEHLFDDSAGFELAVHRSPNFYIAAPLRDDDSNSTIKDMIALFVQTENEVLGWTKWTGLKVLSATVIPKSNPLTDIPGQSDELWLVVEREINSSTVRYLEVVNVENKLTDSSITVDSPGSTTITGLGHLEAETVQVIVDGRFYGTTTVSSSQIDLNAVFGIDSAPSSVTVGIAYSFIFTIGVIKLPGGPGPRQGAYITPTHLDVRVRDSWGASIECLDDEGDTVTDSSVGFLDEFRHDDTLDTVSADVSGWYEVPIIASGGRDPRLKVTQTIPRNFEILATNIRYVFQE